MLFNSIAFLCFLPLVLLGVGALPQRWRNPFLLVASYVFYGSWDWRFLLLLFATTCVDYWAGQRIAAATTPARPARLPAAQPGHEPDRARLLQVLQLLHRLGARPAGDARHARRRPGRCRSSCRSASRSTPSSRWPTSSTSTAATCSRRRASATTPSPSRSSRSWWRVRSSASRTCCRSCSPGCGRLRSASRSGSR